MTPDKNVRYYRSEKGIATRAAYAARPEWKAKRLATNRRLRSEQPDRTKARDALSNALKVGRVVRPDACQECGTGGRIEGHHHLGYAPDHRLDVSWLCPSCHRQAHGRRVVR